MKPLVLISSAVETRFGVYKPQERFDMTVETIRNLREYMPNAVIGLTEITLKNFVITSLTGLQI